MLKTEVDKARLEQAKAAVTPDDSIMIIYTSGTHGRAQGRGAEPQKPVGLGRGQAVHTSTCPEDNVALALPFNHVGGVTCGVVTSLLGMGKYILIPMFSPDHIVAQIKKYGFTTASGVPTMHALVLMNEAYQALDLSQCRMAIVGGSNADDTLLKKMYDSYPKARVMNLYGLSETSGAVVLSPWDGDFETTLKSIGKPIADFEVRVVDEFGKEVALGETGELCFKGDALAKGYYNMPEKKPPKPSGTAGFSPATWDTWTKRDSSILGAGKRKCTSRAASTCTPWKWKILLRAIPRWPWWQASACPTNTWERWGGTTSCRIPTQTPREEEIQGLLQGALGRLQSPQADCFQGGAAFDACRENPEVQVGGGAKEGK